MLSVAAPLVVTVGTAQEARKVSLIPEYTLEEEVGTRQTDRLASWLGWGGGGLLTSVPCFVLCVPQSHDTRSQRHVNVGGEEAVVDMQAVQPYRKIIQHGGGSRALPHLTSPWPLAPPQATLGLSVRLWWSFQPATFPLAPSPTTTTSCTSSSCECAHIPTPIVM